MTAREITSTAIIGISLFAFLMFAFGTHEKAHPARGFQIWKVPHGVSRAEFIYRDPSGKVVKQQSADVLPNYTVEVVIVK